MDPTTLFKCLSDETRLKSILIISVLKEACVCDLMTALGLEQPKVSRHLAGLRKCQILQDERRGKWVYYRLHQSLPTWARTVIEQTVEHNKPYFNDALSALNLSIN